MQKVRCLLTISVLLLGTCGAAGAARYYVDSIFGADSNSGTSQSAPWKSLDKVNSTEFQPGDTIYFRRGGAWEGNLLIRNSGTSDNPLTYRAYGVGAAPQINNPGVTYGHCIEVTGDWNVVQDFSLTDAHEAGIFIAAGAEHNVIRNNEINAAGTGVMVSGRGNLITKNYVHDLTMIVNTPGGNDDYGAVCFWINADDNEISYNWGVNCRAPSHDFSYDGGFVEVFKQGNSSYIHHNYAENMEGVVELSGGGSAQNMRVAYNVFYNTRGGVCMNAGSEPIDTANFRFEHNTFVATSEDGYRVFACRDDLSTLQVRNNIFYSNIQIANNGNFIHTNNLYHMVDMINGSGIGYALGPGEKTGDPLFTNTGAKDFHLQAASPAIDAGLSLGYTQDFEDKPVPVGAAPDMGAYEYQGP